MISFVIPTLNEEKALEKTLRNLSGYRGEKEIILSDGGSKDKTIEIARKYTDLVTVYKGAERQTISGGRNAGAALAHGEYIVFVDADVVITNINDFFKKAIAEFKADKNLVGLTTNLRVMKENATLADKAIFGIFNSFNMLFNNALHVGASFGEFQMIRADVFRSIGGFAEKLVTGEDHDFFRRLSRTGRTYFANDLEIRHTGRRAHSVGWPKLLATWAMNTISTVFFKKAITKEWKVIR
jgi:glycosyltransferase involved in cell wall biosynthesis